MNPILFCKHVKRRNASEFKRIARDIQQSALKVRKTKDSRPLGNPLNEQQLKTLLGER
jgi:hypothetical protein